MQCTPDLHAYQSCEKGQCSSDCHDSGYSGAFERLGKSTHSPRSTSSVDLTDTPKENLWVSVTQNDGSKEAVKFLTKDCVQAHSPSAGGWFETPKVHKRDALVRKRLLVCKSNTDVKSRSARSQCSRGNEASLGTTSEHWLSASFESLDITNSSNQVDKDRSLSGRKRRLRFAQMRTSTLDDATLHSGPASSFERLLLTDADLSLSICSPHQSNVATPSFSKRLPVNSETINLDNSSSALYTPPCTPTPRCIRSLHRDSGFGSLDKSQESSVDHDGSFQELLRSVPKANCETPNLGEAKRRPRLQRQHRLSTLKEGGSQSEEDAAGKKNVQNLLWTKNGSADKKQVKPWQSPGCFDKDDVFTDATPRRAPSVTSDNRLTSAKHDSITPQRGTSTKLENTTPQITESSIVTPVGKLPINLSLMPALELVQAMCRQNALLLAGRNPTLKEQLKSTAGLLEAAGTFRTTMPLAGLIGRKMGLGQVDILTELMKRNLRHILAIILRLLDSESICSFAIVCQSWNQIIQQDKQASLRKRNYLNEVEATLENSGGVTVLDADTRAFKRSALKMIQAQARNASFCTPQSGSRSLTPLSHSGSTSRRKNFLEVAKTLFSDECLKPCPKCESPARCQSVKREGVCSRADCGFQFCTSCLCSFHGSRECGSQSAGRRTKKILIPGSAESKRNIRRL